MNTTERKITVTDLSPADSHVSFYGKAKVISVQFGTRTLHYLQSYETIVAVCDGNEIFRLWDGWSATTGRHLAAFCVFCGFPTFGKKDWDKMSVCTEYKTDDLLQPFNWKRVNVNYGYPVWEW